ncbi:MAG: proteasome assembly chaperone family protein [Candidatus Altiarchaeales archaeon ex4484_2]|nr:MAG: proteasome assembly chaperone family protein [Candidatus Altiarchaeales archaeon ex4484_2]
MLSDNNIKMDDIRVKMLERPELDNPVLIEGLPGVGLVGKLAGDHLLDELDGKKFAEIYSIYLPPQVNIQKDNTVELVNMGLYYWKNKKNDMILLLGGFQGLTPESQYRISDKTLDIAEELGVGRIFTLGGLGTGSITKNPKVYGAATSKVLVDELSEHGVVFRGSGAIFGASGLLLGLGMDRDMDAVCLMGETHGQIIDAKSAEVVLNVLTSMLDGGADGEGQQDDRRAEEGHGQAVLHGSAHLHKIVHSYLSASTGLSCAACLAGRTPDMHPTMKEKASAPMISSGVMLALIMV